MSRSAVSKEDDPERFIRVLDQALGALDDPGVPYLLFGSIASVTYGRPGPIGDVDVLVRPQDADPALQALAAAGFESTRPDPRWLYKAVRDRVLVDVIFRVKGGIYLDDEMLAHRRLAEFEGRKIPMVSPEDAAVIEAVTHEDQMPEHWQNALSILTHADIDWEYLESRSRHSPRRLLSLLVYAQSVDLKVPDGVVRSLFREVYER
jgi:putative nucleotidyltransferase-like protein